MKRGGARAGSGRKAAGPDTTKATWIVSQRAKVWMKQQAMEQGVNIAVVLDMLIDSFIEDSNGED